MASARGGTARPRVLLSSPTGPLGPRHGDAFSCSANAALQLTWAQGVFRAEDLMWHWGLDLIAENLRARSVVLQFPTWRKFAREVRRGYDYVGLSCNVCTLPRVRRMAAEVRRASPGTRIVLGGYGTILPDEALVDEAGRPLADHVCREEGVGFMRRLLGEPEAPLRHPDVILERRFLSVPSGERTGIVFSSLGCPNGCDFCVTSHYFGRRQVRLLAGGREIAAQMAACARRNPDVGSFAILDEDFLCDPERGAQLLAAAEEEREFRDVMIFTSLRSLARFTAVELARMGISRVWIGFEGTRAGCAKLEGREFAVQVAELRRHGIATVASMILGFDYQDRAAIEAEFENLLAAEPAVIQILLLTPCRGTPAWERLDAAGRIIPELREEHRHHDGFRLLFRHPHFGAGELEELQRRLAREEHRRLGPALFRMLRVMHEGWREHGASPDPLLRRRAAAVRTRLERARALYAAGVLLAPSGEARRALREDRRRLLEDFGPTRWRDRLAGLAVLALLPATALRFRSGRFTEPRPRRTEYPASR